jgi:hypothetical protein
LVAVGDSFTFCTTVQPEDTWTAMLGRRFHVPAEDLGVPRLGVFEYLEVLKQVGLPKSPDVVVMNVYEETTCDAVLYWEARGSGGLPTGPRTSGALREIAARVQESVVTRHSYAMSFVVGGFSPGRIRTKRRAGAQRRPPPADVDFRYRLQFGGASIRFNAENADRNEVVYADLLARGRVGLEVFEPALEAYATSRARIIRRSHPTPSAYGVPTVRAVRRRFVARTDAAIQPCPAEVFLAARGRARPPIRRPDEAATEGGGRRSRPRVALLPDESPSHRRGTPCDRTGARRRHRRARVRDHTGAAARPSG